MQGETSYISREDQIMIFLLYSTMDKYLFLKFKNVVSKQIYLHLFKIFRFKKIPILFSVKTDF